MKDKEKRYTTAEVRFQEQARFDYDQFDDDQITYLNEYRLRLMTAMLELLLSPTGVNLPSVPLIVRRAIKMYLTLDGVDRTAAEKNKILDWYGVGKRDYSYTDHNGKTLSGDIERFWQQRGVNTTQGGVNTTQGGEEQ